MLDALFNLAVRVTLLLAAIWIALALLGLKWRFFQRMRRGYGNLVRTLAVAGAAWLWEPEMERQGGGYVAQAHTEYEGKNRWVESEEDGLP